DVADRQTANRLHLRERPHVVSERGIRQRALHVEPFAVLAHLLPSSWNLRRVMHPEHRRHRAVLPMLGETALEGTRHDYVATEIHVSEYGTVSLNLPSR